MCSKELLVKGHTFTSAGFAGLSVNKLHMLFFSLFMSIFFAIFA